MLRNTLWITASFFCFGSYAWFLLIWFALAALAFFLEYKNEPRNYRVIFWCACISACMDVFMLSTVVLSAKSDSRTVLFQLFLPGIPAAVLQLLAYFHLSARSSKTIIGIEQSHGFASP